MTEKPFPDSAKIKDQCIFDRLNQLMLAKELVNGKVAEMNRLIKW
jgi:hypothetical protein